MNPNLGRFAKGKVGLNPLGIGEGFEPVRYELKPLGLLCLNPLGIGEGFEQMRATWKARKECLNPLGIGEGFERQYL